MTLEKTLAKEKFKHGFFPTLLTVVERLPSWQTRTTALNEAGFRNFKGKPWTRQTLRDLYHSYWDDRGGSYSWHNHGKQIQALESMMAPEVHRLAA